jgi:NAD(P)-dependent dehydrogenase (short-subunit alcohol dehydrogenase family)
VIGMTTPQQPLPSGFGKDTTAAEVLKGIDLSGKTAIVTGGYSGIGTETTRALAGAGAGVVVPARRPDAARETLTAAGLPGVEVDTLDLADLDSVEAFAERFLASGRKLDILINNAGVMANPETRVGVGGDRFESQFATNHLGHFALANRLWPALAAADGARVVALSSRGHKRSPIRFDDLDFTRDPYEKWAAYGQAKTANVLFAVQLDKLGQDAGVRAFAVHPGGIITELIRHLDQEDLTRLGVAVDDEGNVEGPSRFKSPQAGASGAVWAATSPQLDGMGGVYVEDTDIAPRTEDLPEGEQEVRGVNAWATDPEAAAKLWQVSAALTGVDAFAGAEA